MDNKKFECSCCGNFLNGFLPGPKNRPNAICPHCDSRERHRLLALYFKENAGILQKNIKMLHFAPEKCLQGIFLDKPNIEYISADIVSKLAGVKTDIRDLIFKDETFDFILCSHVLEHVVEDKKAIQEIFRVLKKGCLAIIQSPVNTKLEKTFEDFSVKTPEERYRVYGQKDHVRIYGRDYPERLRQAGFAVEIYDFVGNKNEEYKKRYGLRSVEKIYLCYKK